MQWEYKERTHLSQEERYYIEIYLKEKKSYRWIGRELGRPHSTIKKEVDRNSVWSPSTWETIYKAREAEVLRLERREKANRYHVILLNNEELYHQIEGLLKDKWGGKGNEKEKWWVDEIVWRIEVEGGTKIASSTVYNFINRYRPKRKKYLRFGQHGYKKRWSKQGKNKLVWVPLIHERSDKVDARKRIGDWEVDMVVGAKWELGGLVTLIERKSRYTRIVKVPRAKKGYVYAAMYSMLKDEKVKTITSDNWGEFALLRLLGEKFKVKVYRCNPYASWEKGSNEKNNWYIRWFCPKRCSIQQYDDEYIQKVEDALNNKPRKILWYKTPYEVYYRTTTNLI